MATRCRALQPVGFHPPPLATRASSSTRGASSMLMSNWPPEGMRQQYGSSFSYLIATIRSSQCVSSLVLVTTKQLLIIHSAIYAQFCKISSAVKPLGTFCCKGLFCQMFTSSSITQIVIYHVHRRHEQYRDAIEKMNTASYELCTFVCAI